MESSAKLRLYARLMAEKMRAYGLSVNPESGKIEEKQRPESAAPVSSALRPQSSPPTAAAPSATNNQSNVTIADAGNAAIAISNANDDDKKAELSKPDEEPDHEILEAEKAISNVDNIARIT